MNFTYDVFDISNDEKFNKENLIGNNNVTSVIFLLDQKVDAEEFLQRIKVIALYFNSLSSDEIKAIKNWIRNTVVKQLADSAIEILEADKMEFEIMVARNAYILDEMKEKAEGIVKGIKEGRQEEKLEIARNMIKLGLDIDTIIKATGLSKEELIEKLNWKAKLVMIFSNLIDYDNEYIRSSEHEEEAKRFFNEYIYEEKQIDLLKFNKDYKCNFELKFIP